DDRSRARHRDLHSDHDDGAGLAHDRARRPVGLLRWLHGRRIDAWTRPCAGMSRSPRDRVRRRRLALHAAWIASDDRRRGAAQLDASALQEQRLSHVGLPGDAGRGRPRLGADGEGRGLSRGVLRHVIARVRAASSNDFERRWTGLRRAPHGSRGKNADDRPRWAGISRTGGGAASTLTVKRLFIVAGSILVVGLILAIVVLRVVGLDPRERRPGLWLTGNVVTT